MKLHELKVAKGAKKAVKRLGRGEASGTGKTSGRGHKGQWARKGHKFKEGFEGGQMPMIRRIPKRGFKNPAARVFEGVNVDSLSVLDAGTEVTPAVLKELGLAKRSARYIKVLGRGDLDRKLQVKAHAFSASAVAKIEAAGGTCEVIAD